ncbi:MAG: RNA polymerase sigma factor [Planctomycetes bacterium]|jgi:RNA polymerase sigma factor (sigma-70 family)|nr:RNA polymerase sigma factor [Planctomycetota bacterium]
MANEEERKLKDQEASERTRRKYCEQLYEQYHEQLQHYLAKRVRNAHDVEDLMQTVFLNLVTHPGDLQNPHAYLFAVAQHALFFYWRCRKRSALAQQILSHSFGGTAGWGDESDPQKKMSDQEIRAVVHAKVAGLTPALHEALRLRYLDGLRPEAAAARAECSCIALKKRLERAKQALLEGCSIGGDVLIP